MRSAAAGSSLAACALSAWTGRRRIPARRDHGFRPNVTAYSAGRWPIFGLASAMPGRVAPNWISPGLRSTPTAGYAARLVLGETLRSAACNSTAARCEHVESQLGSRADRGGHRPLQGAPSANCAQPARAEPGLAPAGVDTIAAGAVSVPGAVGSRGREVPRTIHARAHATMATVSGADRATVSRRCVHSPGMRMRTYPSKITS